jgi:hypothetical protein
MFINDFERSPWEAVNVRSITYDSSCFEHEKKYNLKIDYNNFKTLDKATMDGFNKGNASH